MPIHAAPLTNSRALSEALAGSSPVLVFKHSPVCGVSSRALSQLSEFTASHPDVPVFMIDVIHQRMLSNRLAADLGVRHASPQAIVVRGGRALWSASHFRISSDALAAAFRSAAA